MEDRLLEAVEDGHTTLGELLEVLDADAGPLFLATRRLAREGALAETDPLAFRLTEDGEHRLERSRLDRSVRGMATAGEDADVDDSEAVSATGDLTEGESLGVDREQPGAPDSEGRTFDFASAYAAARGSDAGGSGDAVESTASGDSGSDAATAGGPEDGAGRSGADDDSATSEQGADDDAGSDARPVTAVEGVSEAYAARLRRAEVGTVAELETADPLALSEATGIAASRIERWQGD
jgi:hypothetical protein